MSDLQIQNAKQEAENEFLKDEIKKLVEEGAQMLNEIEQFRTKTQELEEEVKRAPTAQMKKELITVRQQNSILKKQVDEL